jgi:hypothetical protein
MLEKILCSKKESFFAFKGNIAPSFLTVIFRSGGEKLSKKFRFSQD